MTVRTVFLTLIFLMTSTAAWALSTGENQSESYTIALQNAPAHSEKPQVLVITHSNGQPAAGLYVYARYYPRTTVHKGERVCKTGADGTCKWTPTYAGLAKIRLDDHKLDLTAQNVPTNAEMANAPLATQTFSVRFDGVPAAGLVIFIFAFTLLFGTLSWSMTELLILAPRRQKNAQSEA